MPLVGAQKLTYYNENNPLKVVYPIFSKELEENKPMPKKRLNYFTFGMMLPGRNDQGSGAMYRYQFNGKEQDPETYGNGNVYDYGFRVYNPRLGKFLSMDPLTSSYPWYTPYQFAGNMPIIAIDLDGLEEFIMIDQGNGTYLAIWDISARERGQAGTIIYISNVDKINSIDDDDIRKVDEYEAKNAWIKNRRKTPSDSKLIYHDENGSEYSGGHGSTLKKASSGGNLLGEAKIPMESLKKPVPPPPPPIKKNNPSSGGASSPSPTAGGSSSSGGGGVTAPSIGPRNVTIGDLRFVGNDNVIESGAASLAKEVDKIVAAYKESGNKSTFEVSVGVGLDNTTATKAMFSRTKLNSGTKFAGQPYAVLAQGRSMAIKKTLIDAGIPLGNIKDLPLEYGNKNVRLKIEQK